MFNIFKRAPKLKSNQPITPMPSPAVQKQQEILRQMQQLNAQRAKQIDDISNNLDSYQQRAIQNNRNRFGL
jgi:cytoplasmic iron level regulating protein YaaA (DUF328/UPF0246 family)